VEVLKERASKSRVAGANWQACEVLIVDEVRGREGEREGGREIGVQLYLTTTSCPTLCCIPPSQVSMLHGSLLSKLDAIAKHVKNQPYLPFGGVQLIFTGDFFQLPPVSRGRQGGDHDYAFLHPVWQELFGPGRGCCYELSKVFRQAEEPLVALLNDVRYGKASAGSLRLLRELGRELQPPEGIEPTLLFATNERVDRMNQKKLESLAGKEEHVFEATDTGVEPFLGQLRKSCLAEQKVRSRGPLPPQHIEFFFSSTTHLFLPLLPPSLPSPSSSSFLPQLRLREGAQVMLLKNINPGQGLVNGAKGRLVGFTHDEEHLPIVEFASGVRQSVAPEEWAVETSERGRTVKKAARVQVPLKLGWAMTIHKSQGMGLEWLEVKLDDVFEEGQAYVALSRAIKLAGLRVVAFRQVCQVSFPPSPLLCLPLKVSSQGTLLSPLSRLLHPTSLSTSSGPIPRLPPRHLLLRRPDQGKVPPGDHRRKQLAPNPRAQLAARTCEIQGEGSSRCYCCCCCLPWRWRGGRRVEREKGWTILVVEVGECDSLE